MTKSKKPNPYMSYAIHNKRKYEKATGQRNLSARDLVPLAQTDWENEPEEVKNFWKDIAKGNRSIKDYETFFRHETSCQRMDTEAPVMTDCSRGTQKEQEYQEHVKKAAEQFRSHIENMTEQDLLDLEIVVLDVVTYVNYKDGYHLPAEIGLIKTNIRDGMSEENEYTALLEIGNHFLNMKPGFSSDAKQSAEREHGIDVFKISDKVSLEFVISDLKQQLTVNSIVLCRSESLNKVMGSWLWLKEYGCLDLDITVMTIEDFIITVTDKFLTSNYNCEKPTKSQITQFLANPKYDLEPTFRCAFHNTNEASDKNSCARKNAKKLFSFTCELVNDIIDFDKTNEAHYYSPPMNKQRAARGRGRPNNSRKTPGSSNSSSPLYVVSDVQVDNFIHPPRRPKIESSFSSRGGSKGGSPLTPGSPRSYSCYNSRPQSPGRYSDESSSASSSPAIPRKPRLDEYTYDKKLDENKLYNSRHPRPVNSFHPPEAPQPRRPKSTDKNKAKKDNELTIQMSQLSYDHDNRNRYNVSQPTYCTVGSTPPTRRPAGRGLPPGFIPVQPSRQDEHNPPPGFG